MTLHDQRNRKITAFVNDDSDSSWFSTLSSMINFTRFIFQIVADVTKKWKTLLFLLPVFMGYTRGGKNILSCVGSDLDARSIKSVYFNLCEKCVYDLFLPSLSLAIIILIVAAIMEAQAIRSVVDLSVNEPISQISATVFVLIIGTYCLVEVLFGIDEGYNWAPDFLVAYVAAWALRLIFSWDDHARQIAGAKELAEEASEAEKEVKKFGNEWFVT